jgi:hypothetical protein
VACVAETKTVRLVEPEFGEVPEFLDMVYFGRRFGLAIFADYVSGLVKEPCPEFLPRPVVAAAMRIASTWLLRLV